MLELKQNEKHCERNSFVSERKAEKIHARCRTLTSAEVVACSSHALALLWPPGMAGCGLVAVKSTFRVAFARQLKEDHLKTRRRATICQKEASRPWRPS